MFFLLKYMIIILLNETYAQITHDIETILLPASNPTGAIKIPITLKVFGRLIQLNLRRSDRIVSPAFKEWKYNAKGVTEKLFKLNVSSHCFYYHEDHISSAVINFCHEHGLEGFVFVENNTLEIQPLQNDFTPMCLIYDFRGQSNLSLGKPHVIKKSMEYFAGSSLYRWDMFKLKRRHVRNVQQNLTMELAVFVDEAAYNTFMSILDNDEDKLHNIILAYVNRIQAAFNHPSLDIFMNITLIRLKMPTEQLSKLPVSDGEAGQLLDSFCKYANSLNPTDDDDPNHWDIGFYLTGIDLYVDILIKHKGHYRSERNFEITGKAHYESVCDSLLSCAIAEFRDQSEVEYSLTAIEKIGELLGLILERSSNDSQMIVTWSEYSRKKSKKLWERKTCLRDQAKTMISKKENVDKLRKKLTIELAVFVDEVAYYTSMMIVEHNDDKLQNMILDYVDSIQAAFNRPNLDVFINITLIRLIMLKEQPSNLPVSDGNADQLLPSFCAYANSLNSSDDNDPYHWDIALYLTGINLCENTIVQYGYDYEIIKDYTITGKSYHNGACFARFSCAIVEFRDPSIITSSVDAVYNIGNLLGLTQERSSSDLERNITWSEDSRNKIKNLWKKKICLRNQAKIMILKKETSKKENINNDNTRKNSTIELAVFVDEAAHYMSMFLVEHNDDKLHNMILDYVNRIQAAFNNSSLAVSINITLINLLILRNQPSNLPVSDGNVVELLSSFCTYANSLNSPDDIDPNHWDIALYLTGVKLYENVMVKFETHYRVEKNYNITGRAYHDDACDPLFSCAIVEFRNSYEITSSVDAVYKIGNLLGLTEERNSSDLERNITWSEKSRNKIKNLWEEKICLRDQAKTMISKKKNVDNSRKKLSIQLAVFFDKAAYHMYMPILDNDEDKLRNMILAYVNQIQALLHHSSLGASIDISLVKLVIMNKQLSNLSAFDGDHKKMGKSFCNYVNLLYPIYEIDSLQWDIGLYLTGINLYESEKEQKHYSVVGSSFVNYSCTQILSCALVEIGSTGPNAVSGFATSRIAAHEIGHLLGMQHDNGSFDSTCANGKYIMSEWYFSRGQIAWSECSRNIAKELWKTKECLFDHTRRENTENPNALDHSRYHDLPGREWTAKAQCQLFLRDKDANVVTLHDICQVLQCETPHKYGYFFAGPALDGTHCALEKECRSGKCVPVIEPPLPYCEEDNWSEWTEDSCKSDCLTKSKGVVIKRRSCRHGTNKTASCNGPYYDVVLCNDSRLCSNERHTIAEYTASKCTELSLKIKRQGKKYFKYEPQNESGKQASHVVEKPWRACTIHCLREEKISAKYSLLLFYAPRQDMLDFNIDPYFPDGTWCHEKNGQDYYCRQHYCLPENYSIKE